MKYSYRCPECEVFTIEQSMKDDPITQCPTCGSPVKRIIGKNINVIYKSSGFYSTDNAASCPASAPGGSCENCEHFEAHSSL
ncbi:MAG: hypothetical protein FWF83_07405 [Clostridiales bacterium]|nr:hypothetical protein [Clostridiales bacterium]